MTVYQTPGILALPHLRRIDKLVCAMHADRLRMLALEADAGFPARSIRPVVVTITPRLTGFAALKLALRRILGV